MTNLPQQVTERYVSNLIANGRNKDFDIDIVQRNPHVVDEVHIGYYYQVRIETAGLGGKVAYGVGATIAQAVRRCLEKHGVTFR